MSKVKKNDVSDFADLFSDLKKSSEEIEGLLKQSAQQEVEAPTKVEAPKEAAKEDIMYQAFGVHKNKATGKWCVAEILYNPLSGEAKIQNDEALTNLSKSVITARASELMTRVSLGLSIKNVKGYK